MTNIYFQYLSSSKKKKKKKMEISGARNKKETQRFIKYTCRSYDRKNKTYAFVPIRNGELNLDPCINPES